MSDEKEELPAKPINHWWHALIGAGVGFGIGAATSAALSFFSGRKGTMPMAEEEKTFLNGLRDGIIDEIPAAAAFVGTVIGMDHGTNKEARYERAVHKQEVKQWLNELKPNKTFAQQVSSPPEQESPTPKR